MATPASSAGFGTGLRAGLETARQRRIQEEELKRQRQREDVSDRRSSEQHDVLMQGRRLGLDQMRRESARDPERYERESEIEGLRLDQMRREAERDPEQYARETRLADVQLEGAEFAAERQRTTAGREDDVYERTQRQMQAEGMPELFGMLAGGIDPDLARRRFNEIGEKRLERLEYDTESGMVRLLDDEGESVEHSLDDFQRAYPLPEMTGADRYDQVGDYIFDRLTGQFMMPPGGEGGGRDLSPYNPQTVQDDITAGIVRSMGGDFDVYGNYSFGPEGDRQLGDYRIAQAQSMAGRLERQLSATTVTPGQIINSVMEATRDMPTEAQLVEETEEWRTEGRNKEHEDAAEWLANRRNEVRLDAETKLNQLERQLISGAAAPSAFVQPEWVGAPYEWPADAEPLPWGEEAAVRKENGTFALVRAAPDGKTYEVKGHTFTPEQIEALEAEYEASQTAPTTTPPTTQPITPEGAGPAAQPAVTPEQTAAGIAATRRAAPVQPEVVGPTATPTTLSELPPMTQEQQRGRQPPGAIGWLGQKLGQVLIPRAITEALTPRETELRGIASARRRSGAEVAAERVRRALAAGRGPSASDIDTLTKASVDLYELGFSFDEIEMIQEYGRVRRSLSEARTRPATAQPY